MTKKLSDNRIYWLDYAKVIGVFLMIYGHGSLCGDLCNYVYSFHMPMFFFISGIFYKPLPLYDTIKRNWRGLLIPYFLLNFLCFLPQLLALFWHGTLTIDKVFYSWGAVLLGLGYNSKGFIPISTPCWFIYALFIAKVLMAMFLQKNRKNIVLLIVISLLTTIVLQYMEIDLLIPLDSVLLAIPFICIGYLCKAKILMLVQRKDLLIDIITLLFLLLWLILVPINGRVDMNTCNVGASLSLFYIIATIATFVFFRICYRLYDFSKKVKFVMGGVNIVSKSTLLYVAFNLTAISYTKSIIAHMFHLSIENVGIGFLIAVVVFFEHIPICMFVIKNCPVLIGKRK
ncbi:acyltransferase family protein [Prevotella sp.]|uniref:acyltransferase family protein n=1 Tax=Prevotella sp. TaxID=59823 RepID=UPI00307C8F98